MLALTNHQENMIVGRLLRDMDFAGRITAIVRFPEEAEELKDYDIASFNLFAEAGGGFADHVYALDANSDAGLPGSGGNYRDY